MQEHLINNSSANVMLEAYEGNAKASAQSQMDLATDTSIKTLLKLVVCNYVCLCFGKERGSGAFDCKSVPVDDRDNYSQQMRRDVEYILGMPTNT